jgi:hypothetical protein
MMTVLLVFLVPLAALLILGVVVDLRRRRRRDALGSHYVSSAVRMTSADVDVQRTRHLPGGGGAGGV